LAEDCQVNRNQRKPIINVYKIGNNFRGGWGQRGLKEAGHNIRKRTGRGEIGDERRVGRVGVGVVGVWWGYRGGGYGKEGPGEGRGGGRGGGKGSGVRGRGGGRGGEGGGGGRKGREESGGCGGRVEGE